MATVRTNDAILRNSDRSTVTSQLQLYVFVEKIAAGKGYEDVDESGWSTSEPRSVRSPGPRHRKLELCRRGMGLEDLHHQTAFKMYFPSPPIFEAVDGNAILGRLTCHSHRRRSCARGSVAVMLQEERLGQSGCSSMKPLDGDGVASVVVS